MRYYGEDYYQELKISIATVRDSVEDRNYAQPIQTAPISDDRYRIQSRGVNESRKAMKHIAKIKADLDRLEEVIDTFYSDADETGANIIELADNIQVLIRESNSSLARMSRMLRGVGEYGGRTVTSADIRSAGINTQNFSERSLNFWIKVIDTDLIAGNAREEAVEKYLEHFDFQRPFSMETMDRLNGLLDHYATLRFGETTDIRDMDMMPIDHCIKIFENMYPDEIKKLDTFFSKALKKGDDTTKLNVKRIKYAIYTADPEYRDVLLGYLPKIKLNPLTEGDGEYYKKKLSINLFRDYDQKEDGRYIFDDPFCNFFHEMGHGIDHLSAAKNSTRSTALSDLLVQDAAKAFYDNLGESGIKLTHSEKQKVIDFLISPSNINVIGEDRDIKTVINNLPSDWSPEMKDSYMYMRDYYGSRDYIFYIQDNGIPFIMSVDTVSPSGAIKHEIKYKLLSDTVGAVTSNKLASTPFYHPPLFEQGGYINASNTKEFMQQLAQDSYWYDPKSGELNEKAEREFFANSFEANILGYDTEPIYSVFDDSYRSFNDIIDDVHKGLNN
ncbi:MAG: hypothetical protein J6U54_22820 [Clostridiales bacterium]|nr:hypothetical protein [Clostridiales bacterium]